MLYQRLGLAETLSFSDVPFRAWLEQPVKLVWQHSGRCACGRKTYLYGQCDKCAAVEAQEQAQEAVQALEDSPPVPEVTEDQGVLMVSPQWVSAVAATTTSDDGSTAVLETQCGAVRVIVSVQKEEVLPHGVWQLEVCPFKNVWRVFADGVVVPNINQRWVVSGPVPRRLSLLLDDLYAGFYSKFGPPRGALIAFLRMCGWWSR